MLSVQHADPNSPFQRLSEETPHTPPPLWDTQRAQMRQPRHQTLKTLRVGRKLVDPDTYATHFPGPQRTVPTCALKWPWGTGRCRAAPHCEALRAPGRWPDPCARSKGTGPSLLPQRPAQPLAQPQSEVERGGGRVGLGWVGSRPRLVAYPRSAPPSLPDPTGRPYLGVRSQGLPDS